MDILSARIDSLTDSSCGHTAISAVKNHHCTPFYNNGKYCAFWPNLQTKYLGGILGYKLPGDDPIPCPKSWDPSSIQLTIDYRCVAERPPTTARIRTSESLSCKMSAAGPHIKVISARLQAQEKYNRGQTSCDVDVTKTVQDNCDGQTYCTVKTKTDFTAVDAKICSFSMETIVDYKCVAKK
jgi:hypothetical protein